MTATPPLAATLPEPVFGALLQAAEFSIGASICLSITSGILNEMRKAAEAEEPIESNDVDAWREQLDWLVERLSSDLDRLREDVKATGVRAGRF